MITKIWINYITTISGYKESVNFFINQDISLDNFINNLFIIKGLLGFNGFTHIEFFLNDKTVYEIKQSDLYFLEEKNIENTYLYLKQQ